MIGFENRRVFEDYFNASISALQGELDRDEIDRLQRIRKYWNFFEGFHWEDIPITDSPQLTVNYCRAFVNKFVAFELGKSFSFSVSTVMRDAIVTEDGKRTLFEYLEDVWIDNNQYRYTNDMGQMKSVTGEAWTQVRYNKPGEFDDPFQEYPKGRMTINLLPTNIVFAEYDPHNREVLTRVSVMYAYEKLERVGISGILGRLTKKQAIYKQIWTKEKCVVEDDGVKTEYDNTYGIIPFVQIKNLSVSGKNEGVSDLEDLIPLNVELNLKKSNISEILDYHASPTTIVFGARVGNLEKGANKLWGGLPKDAKVENLELKSCLLYTSEAETVQNWRDEGSMA